MNLTLRLFSKASAVQPVHANTALAPEEFRDYGTMDLYQCMDKLMPLSTERLRRIAEAGLPCSPDAAEIVAMRERLDERDRQKGNLPVYGFGGKGFSR